MGSAMQPAANANRTYFGPHHSKNLMIRQLFDRETSTFTYLVADPASNLGLLIDPVLEQGERDMKLAYELGVTLKYAVNTHVHADHVTSSGVLKQKIAGLQSVLGRKGNEMALADVKLDDGDVLEVGAIYLEVRHNPGHTAGCYSFVLLDNERPVCVFTGDAVLIRGCGRTDFQGGNSAELYRSVHAKILSLPDETIVFPAHDYKGLCCSTVGEEKRLNPRLNKTLEEFIQIMAGLNLPYPAKIDHALPLNLKCGLHGNEPVPKD